MFFFFIFFFQAEDGIRDAQESRGLGDVYKRQELYGDAVVYKSPTGPITVVRQGKSYLY